MLLESTSTLGVSFVPSEIWSHTPKSLEGECHITNQLLYVFISVKRAKVILVGCSYSTFSVYAGLGSPRAVRHTSSMVVGS